jgi:hypothetical protein
MAEGRRRFTFVFSRVCPLGPAGMRDAQGDRIMGMENTFRVVGQRRTKEALLTAECAHFYPAWSYLLAWRLGRLSFPS